MNEHSSLEGVMVKTTNGVAVAGMFSPAWLPTLSDASQIAAQLVPIFSLFWLVLQIIGYARKSAKARKGNTE